RAGRARAHRRAGRRLAGALAGRSRTARRMSWAPNARGLPPHLMAKRKPIERDVPIEVTENGARATRPLEELLRRLVALPPGRVLSLYLGLRWRDEQQRDRVWLTARDRLRGEGALGEAAMRFTESRVKQFDDDGFGGAALFLGDGLELSIRTESEL